MQCVTLKCTGLSIFFKKMHEILTLNFKEENRKDNSRTHMTFCKNYCFNVCPRTCFSSTCCTEKPKIFHKNKIRKHSSHKNNFILVLVENCYNNNKMCLIRKIKSYFETMKGTCISMCYCFTNLLI